MRRLPLLLIVAVLLSYGMIAVRNGNLTRSGDIETAGSTPTAGGASPTEVPLVVWAVGSGDGSPTSAKVADLIASDLHIQRFLHLGGDIYPHQSYETEYLPTYGKLLSITSPTPSEKEWGIADERQPDVVGPNLYLDFWSKRLGRPMPWYYSFRLGNWEIISLNSWILERRDRRQLDWLPKQLSEPGTCRIAFWHHGWLSAEADGFDPRMEAFWRILDGHAVLAVNGDAHSMQHHRSVMGITQLVAGTGGNGLFPIRTTGGYNKYTHREEGPPDLEWVSNEYFGAIRLMLWESRADFAFVGSDGRVLHDGSVNCKPLEWASTTPDARDNVDGATGPG